jgi:peroxiredoxin
MPKAAIGSHAPEFTLQDFRGSLVNLSDYKGHQNVLLIFNRGFT